MNPGHAGGKEGTIMTTPTAPVQQRPWVARHKILTAVGALIVIGVIASRSSQGGGGTNVPAAADQANAITTTSPPTPSAAPTGPAAGTVLLTVKGYGMKQTQKFTAAGDWDLAYAYDCSRYGSEGNFMVDVYGSDGNPSLSNNGVNQLGMKGGDVTHEHNGGTYYLSVNSECAWVVRVTVA